MPIKSVVAESPYNNNNKKIYGRSKSCREFGRSKLSQEKDQELKKFMSAIDSDIAKIESMASELEQPDQASKLAGFKIDTSHIKKLISQLEGEGLIKSEPKKVEAKQEITASDKVSSLRSLFEGAGKMKPKLRKATSVKFHQFKDQA